MKIEQLQTHVYAEKTRKFEEVERQLEKVALEKWHWKGDTEWLK